MKETKARRWSNADTFLSVRKVDSVQVCPKSYLRDVLLWPVTLVSSSSSPPPTIAAFCRLYFPGPLSFILVDFFQSVLLLDGSVASLKYASSQIPSSVQTVCVCLLLSDGSSRSGRPPFRVVSSTFLEACLCLPGSLTVPGRLWSSVTIMHCPF